MGVAPAKQPWHRIVVAALTGAMIGWCLVTTHTLVSMVLSDGWSSDLMLRVRNTLFLFALFGLPVAWLAGLLFGFPICMLAVRKGWTNWRAALVIGTIAGFLLPTLSLVFRLLDGLEPGRGSYSYGGSEGMLWQDGWPTALGWWSELSTIALFGGIGALSGLIAWRITIKRWRTNSSADD